MSSIICTAFVGIILLLKPSSPVDHAHGSTLVKSREREKIEALLFTPELDVEPYNLLYFKDSFLVVFCQLRNRENDTSQERKTLVEQYSSQGMFPTVTLMTLAWSKSYEFEDFVEDETPYWALNISKSDLLEQFDRNSHGKTHWTYKVELGRGLNLFESWGSIVFADSEPLIGLTLGDEIEPFNEALDVEDAIFWQEACSPTVALLNPVVKDLGKSYTGCYVAVTYGRFSPNTIRWFNLLHMSSTKPDIYSICKEDSFSSCEKLSILDMTVAGLYMLIVTTRGVVKSQNMEDIDSSANKTKLRFDKVNNTHAKLDDAFSKDSLKRGEIKLQHSGECYGQGKLLSVAHVTYLVYTSANKKTSVVLSSEPPFDVWSPVDLPDSVAGLLALGAAWDIQRGTTVLLLQDATKIQSLVAVLDRQSSQLIQPVFKFPENVSLMHIGFHGHTHSIFVYGSQVWLSVDGGNSFYNVLDKDLRGDTVLKLFTNSLGDEFVLVTKLGAVYTGLSGIPRVSLIEPAHKSSNCTIKLITFQRQKTVDMICLQNNSHPLSFKSISIDLNARIKADVKLLFRPLLVHFKTERQAEFWAYCGDTFFSDDIPCSESFHPSDVGRVLKASNGGSAIITSVETRGVTSDLSARVTTVVLTPFTQLDSSPASALNYPIRVNFTNSIAQLHLQNSLNATGGWRGEDIGRTIQLSNGLTLIVTACISIMDATAKSFTTWNNTDPFVRAFDVGSWFMFDFRPFQASRPLSSSVLHVNHTESDRGRAELRSLSPELFVFTSEHIGQIVKCGSGWGRIISVINNSTSLVELHDISPGDHTENWGIYTAHSNDTSFAAFIPNAEFKKWYLTEDDCRHFLVENVHNELEIIHLDSNEELSFTLSAISKGIVDVNQGGPILRLHIGNALLFLVDSWYEISVNHTLRISLRKRSYTAGISSISVRLHRTASLLCQEASYTIHGGCPPTKRLRFLYPLSFSRQAFLNAEVIDAKGIVRNFQLPHNYRAPSSRGKAIPMSDNIYHVDRKKPLYKTTYAVTRETLRYKQCDKKANHADCQCTDEQRASSLAKDSDCIDTVYRILFTEALMPRFIVSQDGKENQQLRFPFYLEEVNQRRDFKILSASGLTFSSVSATVLEQNLNSSIHFDGSGLYHFRARVVQENYTFCALADEFLVFVVDTPLPFPINDVVRACTGMGFASLLLMVFARYFHGKKKMKND